MEYYRLLLDYLAWIEHQFLSEKKGSRKAGGLWGMMRGVRGIGKSIHQSWLAKGLGLGLLCWGFMGVQKEIPWEEARTLQIGSEAFPLGTIHQSTSLSLSRTIWPRCAWRHFLSLPKVQTLLPVTFGYSPSSQAVILRQLRKLKRLWQTSFRKSRRKTG